MLSWINLTIQIKRISLISGEYNMRCVIRQYAIECHLISSFIILK